MVNDSLLFWPWSVPVWALVLSRYIDPSAKRYNSRGKLVYHPEDRMRKNAYLAALIFPDALIWYGWTVHYGVLWVAPVVAGFFFGLGSMIIFEVATAMLTEFIPGSSSGVAVNNFMRDTFSARGAWWLVD
ncbi:hypothetical protein B0O99DRAFT_155356 [Bisporella sp. PMI_857]|nr:hypothetical protein B0O99DRAFT_155356 [Bisporella sp. PMI_857]